MAAYVSMLDPAGMAFASAMMNIWPPLGWMAVSILSGKTLASTARIPYPAIITHTTPASAPTAFVSVDQTCTKMKTTAADTVCISHWIMRKMYRETCTIGCSAKMQVLSRISTYIT